MKQSDAALSQKNGIKAIRVYGKLDHHIKIQQYLPDELFVVPP